MKNVSRVVRTVHGSFYDDDVIYEDKRYSSNIAVLLWWNETNIKRRGFTMFDQIEDALHQLCKRSVR